MEPCITLGRSDVLALRKFCRANNTRWFIRKSKGVFVGARRDKRHHMTYYFATCNPHKTAHWKWNAEKLFGRLRDFTEYLPPDWLEAVARDPTVVKVHIVVYPANINAEFIRL